MATVNARLRDAVLRHLVNLQRLTNGEVRATLSLLNASDSALFAQLSAALESITATNYSVQRLGAALLNVWEVNEAAYRQLATRAGTEMYKLTEYELQWNERTFKELLPEPINQQLPTLNAQTVYAAATAEPFRGKALGAWFDRLSANRQDRITNVLNIGYVSGKTVDEMVRELRGTRDEGYRNGILQIDRHDAEAVVRTATAHTAAYARARFYEANSDIIKQVQWVSTLDNRTTHECMIRDSLLYTVDEHEPVGHEVPWLEGPGALHWNCRSTFVAVIDSAEALGITLPPLERSSMNGVAAPKATYGSWIKQQKAAVQDDILGPTRGKMLREGKVGFDRFFNEQGDWLTLEELKQRERAI